MASSLAQAIGLNEAIMLQKINLWLNCKPKEANGRAWIYNSYKSWQEQLPFWSESTIRRTLKSLLDQKLILVGNFNKVKFDKTTWYSIDYDKVDTVVNHVKMNNRCVQNEQTICSNCIDADVQIEQTNTNEYTMNTNNDEEKNKKEVKKYGEYQNVFFTDEQYQKLLEDFPNDYKKRIRALDDYIQSKGKKYKDCLATIRNWARKEGYKFPSKENKKQEEIKTIDLDNLSQEDYGRLMRKEVTIQELIKEGKLNV